MHRLSSEPECPKMLHHLMWKNGTLDQKGLAKMSNLNIPAAQWLADQFEFECCEECHGDAEHHTAVPFMGNWFARCDYPLTEDAAGTPHPVVAAHHSAR